VPIEEEEEYFKVSTVLKTENGWLETAVCNLFMRCLVSRNVWKEGERRCPSLFRAAIIEIQCTSTN
jgi:hypothetical protein